MVHEAVQDGAGQLLVIEDGVPRSKPNLLLSIFLAN